MSEFVIPASRQPSVAIQGSAARFPVRRIFCVGRNYAAHAREMGHDPVREAPFFFSKPADALVEDGAVVPYPPQTENLHFEAELVVAIGTGGRGIAAESALTHVWGYGAGNDLTRRDLQAAAKKAGRPWDMAKGFDQSAVCGPLRPAFEIGHPAKGRIHLTRNDDIEQDADLSDMIWSVPDIIAFLSTSVSLAPGDLIMTGTPAGVGPLSIGDHCRVEIEGVGAVEITIAERV